MGIFSVLRVDRQFGLVVLAITLHLLGGCGPSKQELISIKQRIFIDQVTINMSVSFTSSPSADDSSQWESDTGWVDSPFTRLNTESNGPGVMETNGTPWSGRGAAPRQFPPCAVDNAGHSQFVEISAYDLSWPLSG